MDALQAHERQQAEGWQGRSLSLSYPVILLLALPLVYVFVDYYRVLQLRRQLPPGPLPLPLFGHYFITPRKKPWVMWEKWAKKYQSPLITIWNGNRPCIVCSDAWVASDLLEKRAAIYSSRPRMPSMGEMIGSTTTNQVSLVYGDQWRLHRRLIVSINMPSCIYIQD